MTRHNPYSTSQPTVEVPEPSPAVDSGVTAVASYGRRSVPSSPDPYRAKTLVNTPPHHVPGVQSPPMPAPMHVGSETVSVGSYGPVPPAAFRMMPSPTLPAHATGEGLNPNSPQYTSPQFHPGMVNLPTGAYPPSPLNNLYGHVPLSPGGMGGVTVNAPHTVAVGVDLRLQPGNVAPATTYAPSPNNHPRAVPPSLGLPIAPAPVSERKDVKEEDNTSALSGSSGSTLREELPLCPDDCACASINSKAHQRKYAHTCRLFPCYHANVKFHTRLFRHVPGQLAQDQVVGVPPPRPRSGSGSDTSASVRERRKNARSLASVNFTNISPDAPGATKILVVYGSKAYEIHGNWAAVKLHTLRRYLHQVVGVPPSSQKLTANSATTMDDDLLNVSDYGITEGSTVSVQMDDLSAVMLSTSGVPSSLSTPQQTGKGGVSPNDTPKLPNRSFGGVGSQQQPGSATPPSVPPRARASSQKVAKPDVDQL